MGDINTYTLDFGNSIPATATQNEDGTLSIFLNARMTYEQRLRAYAHELRHYQHGDFDESAAVDQIEAQNDH